MSIGQRRTTPAVAGVLVAVLCGIGAAATAKDSGAGALQSAHPPLIRAAAERRYAGGASGHRARRRGAATLTTG